MRATRSWSAGSTVQAARCAIDTTTLGGKLIFHLFGALAAFERDLIRERTHAGLAAARARGQKGRPTGAKAFRNLATLAMAGHL